jgi:hypothetical protein
VEESSKTLFAYYLGADLITVLAVFGLIEAGYDWYWRSSDGLLAPFLSVVGHSMFGAGTVAAFLLTGSLWLGLATGVILHLAYNFSIVRLLANK